MDKLFEAFRRACMFKTGPSRKESLDYFRAEALREWPVGIAVPEIVEVLIVDYFERQSAIWAQRQTTLGPVFDRKRQARSPEELERDQAKWKGMVDDMMAKAGAWAILNTTLPNGKKLRDATGAECARAGGFYAEVARHIKPTQVVDKHLTEADLRNLWQRVHNKTTA